jgi:hypothetical protein
VSILLLLLGATEVALATPVFANRAFADTWARTDKPVEDAPGADRGYVWGPSVPGNTNITSEIYNNKFRQVQYFDKARMEITHPQANPNELWYVTTGLLVKELVTGLRQEGDTSFTQYPASQVQIAGDTNQFGGNSIVPTYASFRQVGTFFGTENNAPMASGKLINTSLNKTGQPGWINPPELRYLDGYDPVTGHNSADVFVDFANQAGLIWSANRLVVGPVLFGNPLYVLGRPITEPYWVKAILGGVEREVMVQLFERRVLTYTPSNPSGFKVEMGNVGQHYFRWRYLENLQPVASPVRPPTPIIPPASPVGINALLDLYNLPQLSPYIQTYQISSHDPEGANYDWNHALYGNNSGTIIFDQMGAGVVYRIWMTHAPFKAFGEIGRLQFYVDNEPTPRVDMSVEDFFSGKKAPFLSPLVGNADTSSGGYYSYVPVPFNKRLVVVVTGRPGYYQISYQKLNAPPIFKSFSGKEDYTGLIDMLNNPGRDPKPARPGRQLIQGNDNLNPGQELSLGGVLKGPALISALKLTMDFEDKNVLAETFIKISWDGRNPAQVEAPLDYFFGSGMNEKRVAGLMAGMDLATHNYYFYYPMPFRKEARISLYNASASLSTKLHWEIALDPDSQGNLVNANTGYFNATFHREVETPNGRDYKLLKATGRGRYVGSVINIYTNGSAIEGDERTYLDGSSTPQLIGTGFEDYFNAGYGFSNGAFSMPLHGSAYHPLSHQGDLTLMVGYRYLLGDAINFNSAIEVGFEQGLMGKNQPVKGQVYTSLALWYGLDESLSEQTDVLNLGDAQSEKAHQYMNSDQVWAGVVSSSYEGEKDTQIFPDKGYNLKGTSQFQVNINPTNRGVIIRRCLDYSQLNQIGKVYVDEQLVGVWFSPGQNQFIRWRDEDFIIPTNYTDGKTTLRIRIEAVVAPSAWSEFSYTIYTLKAAIL